MWVNTPEMWVKSTISGKKHPNGWVFVFSADFGSFQPKEFELCGWLVGFGWVFQVPGGSPERKKGPWLFKVYRGGDYTIRLCGDYNKPSNKDPY